MKTTLDWVRWSRELAATREFTAAQQVVFQLLVSRSNQHGKGWARMSKFSAQTPFTDRHVSTILNQLQTMNVVELRRVRSKPFHWQLVAQEATEQLTLGDADELGVTDGDHDLRTGPAHPPGAGSVRNPSSERSEVQSSERSEVQSSEPVVGPLKDPTSGGREGHAPAAASERPPDPVTGPVAGPVAVADALDEVLTTLRHAPGLTIYEGAVNSVLAGFPQREGYDHRRAAHLVAAQAHHGGLRAPVAHVLLEAQLRKQQAHAVTQAAARSAVTQVAAQSAGGGWEAKPGSEAARQARQARRMEVIARERGPNAVEFLQLPPPGGEAR